MDHFIEEFAHLASDPAHLAFEVATTIVIEGILLGLLWPLVKRHIHRDIAHEHAKIEDEHGLEHPEEMVSSNDPHPSVFPLPYDHEKSGI